MRSPFCNAYAARGQCIFSFNNDDEEAEACCCCEDCSDPICVVLVLGSSVDWEQMSIAVARDEFDEHIPDWFQNPGFRVTHGTMSLGLSASGF